MSPIRALVAAPAVLLLLTLVACGDDSPAETGAPAPTTSAVAPATTESADTPAVAGGSGGDLQVTGTVPASACTIVTPADIASAFSVKAPPAGEESKALAGSPGKDKKCTYGNTESALTVNGVPPR